MPPIILLVTIFNFKLRDQNQTDPAIPKKVNLRNQTTASKLSSRPHSTEHKHSTLYRKTCKTRPNTGIMGCMCSKMEADEKESVNIKVKKRQQSSSSDSAISWGPFMSGALPSNNGSQVSMASRCTASPKGYNTKYRYTSEEMLSSTLSKEMREKLQVWETLPIKRKQDKLLNKARKKRVRDEIRLVKLLVKDDKEVNRVRRGQWGDKHIHDSLWQRTMVPDFLIGRSWVPQGFYRPELIPEYIWAQSTGSIILYGHQDLLERRADYRAADNQAYRRLLL
jgi:hypothetical protein